jgi:hypothetical protein
MEWIFIGVNLDLLNFIFRNETRHLLKVEMAFQGRGSTFWASASRYRIPYLGLHC